MSRIRNDNDARALKHRAQQRYQEIVDAILETDPVLGQMVERIRAATSDRITPEALVDVFAALYLDPVLTKLGQKFIVDHFKKFTRLREGR